MNLTLVLPAGSIEYMCGWGLKKGGSHQGARMVWCFFKGLSKQDCNYFKRLSKNLDNLKDEHFAENYWFVNSYIRR